MALLDLLGRRMALRVLWELRASRLTFRALQRAAETNPSVLNARLAELREAGVVEHGTQGYGLTPRGDALLQVLGPLHLWADDWAQGLKEGTNGPRHKAPTTGHPGRSGARRRRAALRSGTS
jgi:DNA-binding HxlR family transcriptional regulator